MLCSSGPRWSGRVVYLRVKCCTHWMNDSRLRPDAKGSAFPDWLETLHHPDFAAIGSCRVSETPAVGIQPHPVDSAAREDLPGRRAVQTDHPDSLLRLGLLHVLPPWRR